MTLVIGLDNAWRGDDAAGLELARALGRLPVRLEVVGIEGAVFALGAGLSAPVARAVHRVAREMTSGERAAA